MRDLRLLAIFGLSILPGAAWTAVSAQTPAASPETFTASAQVTGQGTGATATVTIQIDRYTTERDRTAITEALRIGGYQGFLPVFKKAPQVGSVEMGGRTVPIRFARQQTVEKGRTIAIVTDGALFFVGGGNVDAKPRTGYELAVIQLEVDSIGLGSGSIAAAARVKPGGPAGVQIDDYAETPVTLATVRKSYK